MPKSQDGPPRWRKIRRRLIILGGLVLVVLGIAEIYLANSLVAPANHSVELPPTDMNVVATTIASESGSKPATWYIPADNSHATVILLHPIRSDRRAMFGRAKLLHDAGYSVLLIDFQDVARPRASNPVGRIRHPNLWCVELRCLAVDRPVWACGGHGRLPGPKRNDCWPI